jgi:hypothetical protein
MLQTERRLTPLFTSWQPAGNGYEWGGMRWLTDDAGRRWAAERVGRTSGMIATKKSKSSFPEPADIIRFSCESDNAEPAREVTTRAGLLEQLTESELKALLNIAPRAP